MNQPGRSRPGSVEYENRSTTPRLPANCERSYSSAMNGEPLSYEPSARSTATCAGPPAAAPLVPVRPLSYCAWQAFVFGLTAFGVEYPFADGSDVYVAPPSVYASTKP